MTAKTEPCDCDERACNGFRLTSPSSEADARARETDGDERGDSPTPRGVWRAVFEAAHPSIVRIWGPGLAGQRLLYDATEGKVRSTRPLDDANPIRVLSLMAGYGSDASEQRRLAVKQGWPLHITGVELCEARGPHLRKWCDDVYIGDWRKLLNVAVANARHLHATNDWDLIVTNPDFSLILENKAKPDLDPAQTLVPTLLEHAPAVLVLHHTQALLKSSRGREVLRRWPPAASWGIGQVSFSGDGKADSRAYAASLFLRGHKGATATYTLPELSKDDRRWRVPPGSEEPSADLPAAPGRTPQ